MEVNTECYWSTQDIFLTHSQWRKGWGRLPGGGVIFTEQNVYRSWGQERSKRGFQAEATCIRDQRLERRGHTLQPRTWFPSVWSKGARGREDQRVRLGSQSKGTHLPHPTLLCKMKISLSFHQWVRKRVKQALKIPSLFD